MDIKEIVKRINENSRLLADGNISEIDRDILLADLRSLYLIAKDVHVRHVISEQPKHIEQPKPVIEEPVIPVKEEVITPVESKPIEIVPVSIPKHEPKPVIPVRDPEPEWVEEVVAMQEQVKTKPNSLNEVFAGEEKSLNTRLSSEKRPAINDHHGRKDLKSMIDFNKQYVLTNELFKGDSHAFQTAINRINDAPTIEAAFEYIKTDLMPKYHWNGEMQSTRLFDKLVRQKFGV